MSSICALAEERATAVGDRVFLRMDGADLRYAQFHELSLGYAARCAAEGISAGDAVCLMMRNSAAQVALWFALNRIGALHVPLNTALTGLPLEHALRVAGPRLVVADAELAEPVLRALRALPEATNRLVLTDDLTPDAPGAAPPPARTDDLDVATLLFTSGTTGPAKACALSHRYLRRQGELHAQALELSADDVLHSPFPLFHIDAATLTVVAALAVGGTAAVGRRFSASGFWDEIRATEASVFNFMGATLSILWRQPPREDDRDHRLRLGWGVPLPEWGGAFEERFGVPLRQVYGLTDAGVPVYDPVRGPRRPPAAGRVLDAFEVRIAATDLTAGTPPREGLGPEEVGEIHVRGREPGLVMNGYHGMPQATAATIVNGWVRTADLGSLDSDGFLTFHGRLSDSIRRRGENISAFEVEQILLEHPDVAEAAAIAVPSELTEDEVMAVVVLRPGARVDPSELHRHCLAAGPAHLAPRFLEIADTLPRTPTQKVEKFRLAERGVTSATWDAERGR